MTSMKGWRYIPGNGGEAWLLWPHGRKNNCIHFLSFIYTPVYATEWLGEAPSCPGPWGGLLASLVLWGVMLQPTLESEDLVIFSDVDVWNPQGFSEVTWDLCWWVAFLAWARSLLVAPRTVGLHQATGRPRASRSPALGSSVTNLPLPCTILDAALSWSLVFPKDLELPLPLSMLPPKSWLSLPTYQNWVEKYGDRVWRKQTGGFNPQLVEGRTQ